MNEYKRALEELVTAIGRDPSMPVGYVLESSEMTNARATLAAGGSGPVAWQPIETAPSSGYFMVYEDGAYRLRLRHEGKWLDTAYVGIECAPFGDVAVGKDAQRILDMRADAGRYKLVLRDGCCQEPTHWQPLPPPPTQVSNAT